jgi:hypothetical protein
MLFKGSKAFVRCIHERKGLKITPINYAKGGWRHVGDWISGTLSSCRFAVNAVDVLQMEVA